MFTNEANGCLLSVGEDVCATGISRGDVGLGGFACATLHKTTTAHVTLLHFYFTYRRRSCN